ncbi:MAG TPA: hypothetical protein HPP97_02895 [Desulfuromonadales bacterium]|nr:hypothetical protein [Desulfuromonadales bacterium]
MKRITASLLSLIVMCVMASALPSVVCAQDTIRINGSGSGLDMMRQVKSEKLREAWCS